jgi:uncharacterized protein (TIGR02265 family)
MDAAVARDLVPADAGPDTTPTIKGIFVNSHIRAVRRQHGDDGVRRLEQLVGRPMDFRNGEDVPVALEVRVIEAAVELLVDHPVEPDELAYEAGRLHFRNFTTTPWAKLLFGIFPRDFRFMILHARPIAERVFKGITFVSEEKGPDCIKLTMGNADYPVDHFRGLFQQWMEDFGLQGRVVGQRVAPQTFEYLMKW